MGRICFSLLALSIPAEAYIGPGLAGSSAASVVGGVLGLGMLTVGSVWYPISRFIGKVKRAFGRE